MTAISIILVAKVTMQASLFAKYLNEHDGKEEEPDGDSLPSTQPQGETDEINECSRQHGIAIQTVRPVCHQVLCARSHFMPKGIHRVALTTQFHIDNGPDA